MIFAFILQWVFPIILAAMLAGGVLRWSFPRTIAAAVGGWLFIASVAGFYLAVMIGLASRLPEFFAYSTWFGLLGVLGLAVGLAPVVVALRTEPAARVG